MDLVDDLIPILLVALGVYIMASLIPLLPEVTEIHRELFRKFIIALMLTLVAGGISLSRK